MAGGRRLFICNKMKLKPIIREILREQHIVNEIGDTTEVYDLNGPDFEVIDGWAGETPLWTYTFSTPDGDKYYVVFEGAYWEDDNDELQFEDFLDVSFNSKMTGVTSKGANLSKQTFSVMATVVKAVNDFMAKNKWANVLKFSTTGENKDRVSSKFKLYKAFMNKHLDPSLGFEETEPDTGSGAIYRKNPIK